MSKLIFNALWFQLGWFISVIYGSQAALGVVALTILIYGWIYPVNKPEWGLIGSVVAIGFLTDTVLGFSEVLRYPESHPLPPFWLVTIWFVFATTLNHSLKKLIEHQWLFVILCIVAGPLSYFAGVRLSDVEFGRDPAVSLSIIATTWLAMGIALHNLQRNWRTI